MLRCPPSQIHLTYEDIRGLEHRMFARKEAHRYQMAANARLLPGPRREIRRAVVTVENNAAGKRAASVESQATLHAEDGQRIEQWPITFINSPAREWAVDAPPATNSTSMARLPREYESPRAYHDITDDRISPPVSSPRRRVDSMLCIDERTEDIEQPPPYEAFPVSQGLHLDGAHGPHTEAGPPGTDTMTGSLHAEHLAGLSVGLERSKDLGVSRPPHSELRPLSSARARRVRPRSHDEHVMHPPPPVEPLEPYRLHSVLPQPRLLPTFRSLPVAIPPSVPETASLRQPINPALDPGAPVFVPRIRFGSAATSVSEAAGPQRSTDGTLSSIDSSHTVSQIRTRRSSELNVEQNLDSRHRVRTRRLTGGDGRPATALGQIMPELAAVDGGATLTRRRTSVLSDENGLPTAPNPNLERYPVLRPTAGRPMAHIASGLPPPITSTARHGPPSRVTSRNSTLPRQVSGSVYGHSSNSFRPQSDLEEDPTGRPNAPSPALPASSMSTPNLLQQHSTSRVLHPHSRGSSLNWRSHNINTPDPAYRHPSIASAARDFSDKSSTAEPDHIYRAEIQHDPTAEILATRNSPLDELTERLVGVAMNPRLRSVGRSYERLRHGRPVRSLLSGSLFTEPFQSQHQDTQVPITTAANKEADGCLTEDASFAATLTQSDVVANNAVPSSSSPMAARSPPALSLGPRSLPSPSNLTRQPLTRSNMPTNPVSSAATPAATVNEAAIPQTPRIRIYDDSRPAATQPQTPADMIPSTARASNRHRQRSQSHTTTQTTSQLQSQQPSPLQPPIFIGRSIMASPPAIPPRHAHRHTFPTNIVHPPAVYGSSSTVAATATTTTTPARPPAIATAATVPTTPTVRFTRTETRTTTSDENSEDFEAHVPGLEADRRVWLGRREQVHGALEVTPPAEGRFERFLEE